jgi:hypothetical protein
MSVEDINGLTYPDATNIHVPVPSLAKAWIRILKAYHLHRNEQGNPIGDDWISITAEEFDEFRIGPVYNIMSMGIPSAPSTTPPSASLARTRDPVADFKQGIKRDPTLFTTFKLDKQWVSWQRWTLAQARAQDVSDVLDPTFSPSKPEDKLLFEEKQKYVYAIFEQKLQTDKGKALVREYETTSDAQAVYSDLVEHYTRSVKASLDQSQLMIYITTIWIGDGSWHGSAASFVLNWQDKVREFEKLSDTKNHFSDEWKLIMLQNAVHPLSELRQVKTTADQNKVAGIALTYESYFKLLYSAAVSYNEQFTNKRSNRRSALMHDMFDSDVSTMASDGGFNIDTGVDTVLAHIANRSTLNVRIPGTQWFELSTEARDFWQSFSEADKAIILGSTKNNSPPSSHWTQRTPGSQRSSGSSHSGKKISSYVHELSIEDEDPNTVSDTTSDHDDPPAAFDTVLLANVTKQKRTWSQPRGSDLPPTDIRKVLSTKNTRKDSHPDTASPQELVIDGRRYCAVNVACIYSVSFSHCTTVAASLVDRGANGGIAGEDVRVIEMTLWKVDVHGINNHEVSGIPIAMVGAIILTQHGLISDRAQVQISATVKDILRILFISVWQSVIYRSNIRSALDPKSRYLRLDPLNDDDRIKTIIQSHHDSPDHGEGSMPIVDPNNLIGCMFLMPQQEDGQRFRACTCVDQIIDLCTTLRYLGVPIRSTSYMFGDNKTVVDSSSIPHAKLHKCHNALSFHRVREAVAAKFVAIYHLDGIYNPADILSKHWGYQQIWRNLKLILFHRGDTAQLYDED